MKYIEINFQTRVFLPVRVKPFFASLDNLQICQEGIMYGHRGVNDTLDKFQKTFFVLCTWDKIRRLVERCDICLTKERSIKPMMGPHVPSTVGNVWEIVYEIVSVFDIDSL